MDAENENFDNKVRSTFKTMEMVQEKMSREKDELIKEITSQNEIINDLVNDTIVTCGDITQKAEEHLDM